MKVIDLLVKISKGEEVPKKFIWKQHIWTFKYKEQGYYKYNYDNEDDEMIEDWFVLDNLNDEIEVIEEPKKIEKLEPIYKLEQDMKLDSVIAWQKANNKMFENKINELIDYINNKENKDE